VNHFARLGAEQRSQIFRHLVALDAGSRVLRFGSPTPDEAVARYVAAIDFERDIVVGVSEEDLLVGIAHLAVYKERSDRVGELGISVSAEARHRHLGQELLSRVLVHARLMRLVRVHVMFVARNDPMARLTREFTDAVEIHRGEAHATIDLEDIACASA